MSAGLGLPSFADRPLPLDTWRKRFGCLPEPLGLFGKAFFKRCSLLDAASVHGASSCPKGRRRERVMAFSSPIDAKGCAVMGLVWHVRYRTYGQF
ncbi:hypothetical protein BJS_03390 [Bradyrhizobium japonicum SEMIA 5079]|nr:hypothetical protein BJS_03390 [Bradyrhizobium japonicum SEMIA 5079]